MAWRVAEGGQLKWADMLGLQAQQDAAASTNVGKEQPVFFGLSPAYWWDGPKAADSGRLLRSEEVLP